MRRRLTTSPILCGAMLGAFGLSTGVAEAGPIVSHPVISDSGRAAAPANEAIEALVAPRPGGLSEFQISLETLGYSALAQAGSRAIEPGLVKILPQLRPEAASEPSEAVIKTADPGPRRATPRRLTDTKPIPEPTSLILLATGLLGLAARRHLLKKRS